MVPWCFNFWTLKINCVISSMTGFQYFQLQLMCPYMQVMKDKLLEGHKWPFIFKVIYRHASRMLESVAFWSPPSHPLTMHLGENRPKLDLPNATMKQSCNNGDLLSQHLQACQKFIHGASTTMITEWYKKAVQPSYRTLELGLWKLSAFIPT